MNEKKQPQKEVAYDEMVKPLNQNQIHRQASLLANANTKSEDLSLIQTILLSVITSAIVTFIIWLMGW